MALASTGAPAPVSPSVEEPTPLDLHSLYHQQESCGYTRSLLLAPHTTQSIATRLRGICAISGLLTAATDEEMLTLGDWLRCGLLDALRSLAFDAQADLERANERAQEKEQLQ